MTRGTICPGIKILYDWLHGLQIFMGLFIMRSGQFHISMIFVLVNVFNVTFKALKTAEAFKCENNKLKPTGWFMLIFEILLS